LPSLLGKEIGEAEVTRFLKKLDAGEAVRLTELKEPRWISEDAGVVVYASPKSARIHTVFLYADGHEGHSQYKGPLPHGIKFSMDMKQVKSCFSKKPSGTSDEHLAWDFDDYRIVVNFDDEEAITIVGLTSDL